MEPEGNNSFSSISKIIFVFLLITILFSASFIVVLLFRKSANSKTTNTTAGTDEQRDFPLNNSKTPTPAPTLKKGGEVVSEGILLKYPIEHQSYSNELYIKKDNGLEHVIDITELVKNPNFNLKDGYLNKKVRVTGYLIPVAPLPESPYPFETRLRVEKMEILLD
ncbi:hypothetical protein A2210_00115 [Candidatus Woesebacteria bacterium RIFOXYA1_FULL_40_18]|uniref:Uncharacterized protein n=1 Tax=Candidatus Woesebacteria bacterium RIFOXYA1_FULL_40_18 TaxID=1802532 RepID=A0A1F8CM20_9BACT|nr:MAG: hypothetical protein A2210_00115 [Candidatus Woesebacteria bacterium RIFOXYA1_FULL_40_18]